MCSSCNISSMVGMKWEVWDESNSQDIDSGHSLNLHVYYIIWDVYALQASLIHNSHYRIIFFRGSFFYVYIESPNPKKTQKTAHHSLETPSTDKANPKNQIHDLKTPTPQPPWLSKK